MEKRVAVYKLENSINRKLYIGQSIDPLRRFKDHVRNSKRGLVRSIYCAMRKYGADAFSITILKWCETKEAADELEAFLIEECETRKKGYNMAPGGEGNGSGEDSPHYGKKQSSEHLRKLSEVRKGRTLSENWKKNISEGNRGKKMPQSFSEKMSIIHKGSKRPDSHKEKCRQRMLGNVLSDETKLKLSLALKGRKVEEAQKIATSLLFRKPVFCKELNITFLSMKYAAIFIGFHPATISAAIKNKTKIDKKYSFEKVML